MELAHGHERGLQRGPLKAEPAHSPTRRRLGLATLVLLKLKRLWTVPAVHAVPAAVERA
jgi:hypothetical protein